MRARLFAPTGELPTRHEFRDEVTLGRGRANSLVLESSLLSSFHAKIEWNEELGCYRLQDMGSTNGTRLDGRRLEDDALLGHLHVITLADRYDFVFQDLERCAARQTARLVTEVEAAEDAAAKNSAPKAPPKETTSPDLLPVATPRLPPDDRAPAPAHEKTQHTSIESLALALPELLRARGAQGEDDDRPVPEGTILERLPLPLPGFLRSSKPQTSKLQTSKPQRAPEAASGSEPASPAPPTRAFPGRSEGPLETPPGSSLESSPGPPDAPPVPASRQVTVKPPPSSSLRATVDIDDWLAAGEDDDGPLELPRLPHGDHDVFFLATRSGGGTLHFELQPGANVIGRSPQADVRINSPEISRQHARLVVDAGHLRLSDLGSRNKTYVDDEALEQGQEVDILPGQRLRFGALDVVLGVSAAGPPGGES